MSRGALVIAAAVLAGAVGAPIGRAQPAPALGRARDLYASAEAAMKDGRFEDAARDYGAAYELSKDPALFFKIGRARERAGQCDVAVTYYARYLREGHPAEQFVATTRARITACGGDADAAAGSAASGSGSAAAGTGSGGAAAGTGGGSAAAGTGSGSAAAGTGSGSAAAGAGSGGAAAGSGSGSAAAGSGSGSAAAGSGSGSAAAGTETPLLAPTNSHKIAWILTGSTIALASLGGILAFAARSSEDDVRDLYLGFAGQTPAFDARTKKSYDDLVAQGHRYEHLSWAAFGVAGAAAVGAVVLFATGRRSPAEHARITPVVTPSTAGVSVRF